MAAVFGDRQGSGYLLTEQLVLTSAHLGDGYRWTAIVPGGTGEQECRILWWGAGEDRDVALLAAERSLVAEPVLDADPEWGVVQGLQTWPGSTAVGYPQIQREHLELGSHQVVGRFNPGTGPLSGGAVLEDLDQPVGSAAWAGMSGAAVFVEGLLAGIVRAVPAGWKNGRLELVPVRRLVTDPDFVQICAQVGHRIHTRDLTAIGQGSAAEFEHRLRNYIATQVDHVHITGLPADVQGDEARHWSLRRSFVDLRFAARDGSGPPSGPGAQAAGSSLSIFAGPDPVLVVGAAGSGKTMLLQWLASMSARREAVPDRPDLTDLFRRVPLLLQLRVLIRRGELPGPEAFLSAVAQPLAGHSAASGWVTDQLLAGRVLLLIDGLDEVAKADRARVRTWLEDLMVAFPGNKYIVTSRPAAVPAGWLKSQGFVELETQPMTPEEIIEVVNHWFDAVRDAEDEPWRDRTWPDRARQTVIDSLRQNPDFAELATSPLMCTLICALAYTDGIRNQTSRTELYAAALALLLERRDVGRGIGVAILPHVSSLILGRFAFWLALEGAVELETDQALALIRAELSAMGLSGGDSIDPRQEPMRLLRSLLVSSGVLKETSERTIRFIHLPFQNFLAARTALDENHINLLVKNAYDEDWTDILTLAAAQAPSEACERLLRGLLKRRHKDPQHADRIAAAAKLCLDFAEQPVDPELREQILAMSR